MGFRVIGGFSFGAAAAADGGEEFAKRERSPTTAMVVVVGGRVVKDERSDVISRRMTLRHCFCLLCSV